MDKTLASKVIDTARFYMSGDNCQPFRYRFNIATQTFHIDYLADKAKHTFVYDDYTILLTLGSLLEYLDITLKENSYDCKLTFNFDKFCPFEDYSSVCTVNVHKKPKLTNEETLFSVLKKRFTDRRAYLGPATIDIKMGSINKNLTHSSCQLFKNAPSTTLDFFAACDSAIWHSKALGIDIMNAVAFDPNSPTGLPWRNLGVKTSEVAFVRLIQKFHWFFDLMKLLGARILMTRAQKKLWQSSNSCLIFKYNASLSRQDKVIACKQMMQTLLQLSKEGYVFQPSTMSAEFLNIPFKSINIFNSAKMSSTNLIDEIDAQRELLDIKEEIQWVLRVGKVKTPLDESALTNRQATETLLKFE